MSLNIGSWNVGGFDDHFYLIKRADPKKAKKIDKTEKSDDRTKLVNETRLPSIVNIIKERIKESPIMCLQEVDKTVFDALIDAKLGVVWDGHDAAIVFD